MAMEVRLRCAECIPLLDGATLGVVDWLRWGCGVAAQHAALSRQRPRVRIPSSPLNRLGEPRRLIFPCQDAKSTGGADRSLDTEKTDVVISPVFCPGMGTLKMR